MLRRNFSLLSELARLTRSAAEPSSSWELLLGLNSGSDFSSCLLRSALLIFLARLITFAEGQSLDGGCDGGKGMGVTVVISHGAVGQYCRWHRAFSKCSVCWRLARF